MLTNASTLARRAAEQVGRADDVGAENRCAVQFAGIGAVSSQMQDPLGTRRRDDRRDGVPVGKVELDHGRGPLDLGEAPAV